MTGDNDPPRRRPPFDFDNNDFNEFFKNIQRFIEDLMRNSNLGEDFEKFLSEMGERSNFPFVWGFSIGRDAEGRPRFEQFGDFIRQFSKQAPFATDEGTRVREPIVDVIEEDEIIRVIVELPGVEKKDISLHATESKLKIRAESEQRRYRKEIELPDSVIPSSAKASFKNGVLEIVLDKTTPEPSTKIDIE